MSAQFSKWSLRSIALLGVAVVLSACSAGGSPRPEPAASAVAPAPEAQQPPRRSRRAVRDAANANAEAAQQANAAMGEPLAIAPERALQAYDRALSAMRADDWIEAEFELEQLVLEYPDFAGPFVNLAIVYMHDDRKEDAAEALEQALQIDPAHVAGNNQFAILLREQGRFEEAEQAYRRALQSDPSYALAYYNLGVLLDLYLGRQSEALEYYEQYQGLLAEPDQQVGRWIVDLRRRLGVNENPRVAQGEGA